MISMGIYFMIDQGICQSINRDNEDMILEYIDGMCIDDYLIPAGKRLQFANWKITMFYSWVNKRTK